MFVSKATREVQIKLKSVKLTKPKFLYYLATWSILISKESAQKQKKTTKQQN